MRVGKCLILAFLYSYNSIQLKFINANLVLLMKIKKKLWRIMKKATLLRTFMIFTFVLTFFRVDYEISAINAFVNFIPKVFHLWYGMSRKFYCLF